MISPTILSGSPTTAKDVIAGFCAQIITALMGVTFGAICSRPIIHRRSWSVLLGVLLGMATVLIPHGPPTRQLLVLFNETGHFALGPPVLLIGPKRSFSQASRLHGRFDSPSARSERKGTGLLLRPDPIHGVRRIATAYR